MKASEFIKDIDIDLYNFLNEELAPYEDLPPQFYNKDFIPTREDIEPLSDEQLVDLKEIYNEYASDAIEHGEDAYRAMHRRYMHTKELVDAVIKDRAEKEQKHHDEPGSH